MARVITQINHRNYQNVLIVVASVVVAATLCLLTQVDEFLAPDRSSQTGIGILLAIALAWVSFLVRDVMQSLRRAARQIDDILSDPTDE